MPLSLFSRKKRPFKDFYADWFNALLSLLHRPQPNRRDLLLNHLIAYYDALDDAATHDVAQVLFPSSWRNSLEIPFLFFGDLHPYLFTHFLRSLIKEADDASDGTKTPVMTPYHFAFLDPSDEFMARIGQIEAGMRLLLPPLVSRARNAQAAFAARIGEEWVGRLRDGGKSVLESAVKEETEELVSAFLDVNRLRKSVITEIAGATDIYQGTLFLEGLAHFLVGFKEPSLVAEFESCKLPQVQS